MNNKTPFIFGGNINNANNYTIYFLRYYREKMINFIINEKISSYFDSVKNFIEEIIYYMHEEILQVSKKTIEYEFSIKYLENKYQINRMIKNKYDMSIFMDKYKNLIVIIDNIIEQSILCYQKIIRRYLKDIPMLIERNFIDEESIKIKSIKFVGDRHNGGERVAILETISNKIVYKPRSLEPDKIFEKIIILLNDTLEEERYKNIYPRTIDCGNYGWVEFINVQKQLSMNKEDFAAKLGVITAIFQVFNTSDIHEDNILIYGDYPVVIDLETIAQNTLYEDKLKTYSSGILDSLIIKSFSRKNHIFRTREANRIFNKEQNKYKNILLRNETIPLFIIDDYIEYFFDGYEKGIRFILLRKSEVIELINQYKNCKIRFIPRNTAFYQNLLNIITNPILYRDFKICQEFLRILLEDSRLNRIVDYEIRSLLNNDIPYFYTRINSVNLYHIEGIIHNFFKMTTETIIKSNIEKISLEGLATQKKIIRDYLKKL